jgi:MFS family permease
MSIMETDLTVKSQASQRDWDALYILIGGILGMVITIGIGRFAFTPILPLMQRDLGMSNTVAGSVAGLNYLGYLSGAVLCSIAPWLLRSRYVAISSLLLSIVTTMAMGLTVSVFWWGSLRFVGGVASAMLFITISAEVGETLVRRGYGNWVGALYGGVGAGIVLSGLMIPWLDRIGQWDGAWIGMGVLAVALAVLGIAITRNKIDVQKISKRQTHHTQSLLNLWPLVVAYFFEGLGYIVTATFIVAIVAMTPGLEAYASYSWVAVGLAATPSTVVWPMLARRIGYKNALLTAYALQASGIFVTMHADTFIEVAFVAISFGGTFMGIVAMTMAEGNSRMKYDGKRAAAILTASFGAGQVIGPILAGILADLQEGFALSLLLATICVITGWLFTAIDSHFVSQKQHKGESSCRT